MSDIRRAALVAYKAGLCVVPPREDGSKRPQGQWEHWQTERPSAEQMRSWYGPCTGMGLVCGAVSGSLEMFEFEKQHTYQVYCDTGEAIGLGELIERVAAGYCERTPGGGFHWLYRCAEIGGNTPLARRSAFTDDGKPTFVPLIETRGEGGYVVVAPSHGQVHPSGAPYVLVSGGFATIAEITPDERRLLWSLARALDEVPKAEPQNPTPAAQLETGDRPGDLYNQQGAWSELLPRHGWELVYRRGDTEYWRRPGKAQGISATINAPGIGANRLYVFSSSTPFDPNRSYSLFQAFTVLEHNGDWTAAAKSLAKPAALPKLDGEPVAGALPEIDAGDMVLPSVTGQAWAAITKANEPAWLFRVGGKPARIEAAPGEPPAIREIGEHALRGILGRVATWYKWGRDERRAALPPVHVVRDALSGPSIPLPLLTRIVGAPVFDIAGGLCETPGYAPATTTYFIPADGLVIPRVSRTPSQADVEGARALLVEDLLGDFPFTSDAERAHAVALLLLPFVRDMIVGPTPLHLIEKPTPGTGASLLAEMLTYPALGHAPAIMTEGRDEDEWRKRITARLFDGSAVVLIDNLRSRLDSAAVSAVLTTSSWSDRILGQSRNVVIPIRSAWIATGNNPMLSNEITRRTVRIRLNAQTDQPWLRTTFRHPDLRDWAAEHRGELVWAALTLVSHWVALGRPLPDDLTLLGSYEAWSRVLGGVLSAAGIPGFLGNLTEFYEASDAEGAEMRVFLSGWWEKHGSSPVSVAELFPLATDTGSTLNLGKGSEHSQKSRLGLLLRTTKERFYHINDETMIGVFEAGKSGNAIRWRLAQRNEVTVQTTFAPSKPSPTLTQAESAASARNESSTAQPSPTLPTLPCTNGQVGETTLTQKQQPSPNPHPNPHPEFSYVDADNDGQVRVGEGWGGVALACARAQAHGGVAENPHPTSPPSPVAVDNDDFDEPDF